MIGSMNGGQQMGFYYFFGGGGGGDKMLTGTQSMGPSYQRNMCVGTHTHTADTHTQHV